MADDEVKKSSTNWVARVVQIMFTAIGFGAVYYFQNGYSTLETQHAVNDTSLHELREQIRTLQDKEAHDEELLYADRTLFTDLKQTQSDQERKLYDLEGRTSGLEARAWVQQENRSKR